MATLQKPKPTVIRRTYCCVGSKDSCKSITYYRTNYWEQDQLTALMITHNMKDALRMGNRLVMMHDGKIIFDVEGEKEKADRF